LFAQRRALPPSDEKKEQKDQKEDSKQAPGEVEDDEQLQVTKSFAELMTFPVDSGTRVELQTPEGVTAVLDCSMRTLIPKISVSVFGEGSGRIDVINWMLPHWIYNKMTITDPKGKVTVEKFTGDSTYLAQLKAFANAVETGSPAPTLSDTRDAVKNMRVIDNVYRSLGLPIRGIDLKEWHAENEKKRAEYMENERKKAELDNEKKKAEQPK
jgi:predicted dehydrogenase